MRVTYARPISPRNYSQATAGVKYSSAKMISPKDVQRAVYQTYHNHPVLTQASIPEFNLIPNTTRTDIAYPITLSMIGRTSSFLRYNKTSICGLTESQIRKTIKRQEIQQVTYQIIHLRK